MRRPEHAPAVDDMGEITIMLRSAIQRAAIVLGLAAACAFGQAVTAFNASGLVKLGDEVKYGSYSIIKIAMAFIRLPTAATPKPERVA